MLYIYLLELDYAKDSHIFPIVSIAAIIVTLGVIDSLGTELLELGNCHFILRKSAISRWVSSTKMYLVFSNYLENTSAHYYLRYRLLSEFPSIDIGLIFRNRMPLAFITCRTSTSFISTLL